MLLLNSRKTSSQIFCKAFDKNASEAEKLLFLCYNIIGDNMYKYKNKKIIIDGIKFDSRKEGKRYTELKIMEQCGLIKDLKMQVSYELQPTFRKNNKTYRSIKYIADFVYYDIEREETIVEDTKGFKTEVYKIKKKLFEYKYPDLTLREL